MRRLTLVLLLAASGNVPAFAFLPDSEARKGLADLRAATEARFDQQARSQLELVEQLQRQSEEIARLRGQMETLTNDLDVANKRLQDFYLDIDSRLRPFESAQAPAGSGHAPKTADPAREAQEYDAALALFKTAKYKEAGSAFGEFVERHPNSALAPNAQYWLGNAWYAQRNCTKAIEALEVITGRYASSDKAPDAWLSIATCQQELGKRAESRKTMETLVARYPASPAAETARTRLKKK